MCLFLMLFVLRVSLLFVLRVSHVRAACFLAFCAACSLLLLLEARHPPFLTHQEDATVG